MFRNRRSVWNVRAMPRDLVRFEAHDRLPLEEHLAVLGWIHARDDVEQRGLPRSVRPDNADDLPLSDPEV
jgi:hypothetical protein